MSIYKHSYRAYMGTLTPHWSRIVVLARYALAEAWSSKITIALFTFSMLPAIVYLVGIYLANNPLASALILRGNKTGLSIDAAYFLKMCSRVIAVHSALAWVLGFRRLAFESIRK